MKPRWKSVWITPAASGARASRRTVHARVSFGPAVKNVSKSSNPYPTRIILSSPASESPSSLKNSAASSSDKVAISASIAAETTTWAAPSVAAISATACDRALPVAASASPTLQTYKTGLEVKSCNWGKRAWSASSNPSHARAGRLSDRQANIFSINASPAIASRRGSGTATLPVFGSIVQKG